MNIKLTTLPWLLLAGSLPVSAAPPPAEVQMALADSAGSAKSHADLWGRLDPSKLKLRSHHVLVLDRLGHQVYAKSPDKSVPIASITKLMTAIVTLDAKLDPDERITITREDQDRVRHTGSRLAMGGTLPRKELLRIALMSSENRAASALGRTYPGGKSAFVRAMNRKAQELGMHHTHFVDSTGLDARDTSTARDLARLVLAAEDYPQIREATTTERAEVRPYKHRGPLGYRNTNRLVGKDDWDIGLSKTGYINEAGRCLVMSVEIASHPLVVVLLDSFGKLTPIGDSARLRSWIEAGLRNDPS